MKNITYILFVMLVCTAFGYPVRSAIATRGTASHTDEQKEYNVTDYVQDGLIAMWDGIVNAGIGIHEQDADYWVDLTGGGADWLLRDSYTPEMFEIGDDYVKLLSTVSYNGRGYCTPSWSSSDEIVCCELVIDNTDFDQTVNNSRLLVSFAINERTGNKAIFMRGSEMDTQFNTYPLFSLTYGNNAISLEFGSAEVFVNGEIVIGKKSSFATLYNTMPVISGYGYGDAYCAIGVKTKSIRLYSRSMSIEERKHNWTVDRARFGL